jgi:hypothetical protein
LTVVVVVVVVVVVLLAQSLWCAVGKSNTTAVERQGAREYGSGEQGVSRVGRGGRGTEWRQKESKGKKQGA